MGQDLLQMINAGFNPLSVIAETTGKDMATLKEEMSKGKISIDMLNQALQKATGEGGKFHGMLDAQSRTLTGAISNLRGAWEDMLNSLGEQSEGTMMSLIAGANYAVEHYRELGEAIAVLVGLYGAYRAAIIATHIVQTTARSIRHTEEAAQLLQLLSVEQQAKISKLGLLRTSAEYAAAVKAEALATQQAAATAAAKAQADLDAAKESLAAKAMEERAAQRAVATRQTELATALESGKAKKIQAAQTALATAQEELNTAATARNTAATELSTAASRATAAGRTADTLATGVNTAAQTANAASTGVLAMAKRGLTVVAAKLNAVLMANPYAAVAAAVVALGYATYKLITHQTEAEKRQKALNKAVEEGKTAANNEAAKLDLLFQKLKNAKQGTEAYKNAKQAIINQYGGYFQKLGIEAGKVSDLTKYYNNLRDAVMKAARARMAQKFIEEQGTEILDREGEKKAQLVRFFEGRYGKGRKAADGKTGLAERMAELALAGKLDLRKYGEEKEVLTPALGSIAVSSYGVKMMTNRAEQLVDVIKDYRKEYQEMIDQAQTRFSVKLDDLVETSQASPLENTPIPTKGEKDKDAQRAANAQREAAEKLAKMRQEEALQLRQAALEAQQERIADMADGKDKELEQARLEKYRDQQEAEWQAKGIKKGAKFDRAAITELPDEQLKDLTAKTAKAQTDFTRRTTAIQIKYDLDASGYKAQFEKMMQQQADRIKQMQAEVAKFRPFEQRREEANAYYDEIRDRLEAQGSLDEQIAQRVEAQRKAALRGIADEEFRTMQQSSTLFADLFSGMETQSSKRIRAVIEQVRAMLQYLRSTKAEDITPQFGFSAEQLATLQQSPEQLKAMADALEKLQAKANDTNPFATLAQAWKQWQGEKGTDAQAAERKAAALRKVAATAAAAAADIGSLAGQLGEMFRAAGNEQLATAAEDIQKVMGAASNIAQGFSKGVFSGVMATLGEGIKALTDIFAAEARHQAALRELQEQRINQQHTLNGLIRQEMLAYKEAETIFGTMAYAKTMRAIEVMRKAQQAQAELIRGNGQQGKMAGLANIDIVTGHKKTGLFGWGKGKDLYSSLLAQYPNLIDANGKFNRSVAESILQTAKFKDKGKEALQAIIDADKEVEAAANHLSQYLSGIFGSFAENATTALRDAFYSGVDAAKELDNVMNDMLQKLADNMVTSEFLAPIFERASQEAKRVMEDSTLSKEQRLQAIKEVAQTAKRDALQQKENIEAFYQAANIGHNVDKREGMSKGIATASQDSVDENNARLTTIQAHTYQIAADVKLLQSTTTGILKSVLNIEMHTAAMSNEMGAMRADLRQVRSNIEDIQQRGLKMK